MTALVCDATSLIILAKLDRIDLLHQFFERIYIPSIVLSEVCGKDDHDSSLWKQDWILISDGTALPLYQQLSLVLDPGESEALALAKRDSLPLLIDEKKGRAMATRMGIPYLGLIGLLVRAVERDFLSQAEGLNLFQRARATGFRVSESLANAVLQRLGANPA